MCGIKKTKEKHGRAHTICSMPPHLNPVRCESCGKDHPTEATCTWSDNSKGLFFLKDWVNIRGSHEKHRPSSLLIYPQIKKGFISGSAFPD